MKPSRFADNCIIGVFSLRVLALCIDSSLFLPCKNTRRVFIIKFKEKFNSFGFVGKGLRAVALVNRFVQGLMRLYQIERHGVRVVQVGKAGCFAFFWVLVCGTIIQYLLRCFSTVSFCFSVGFSGQGKLL